MTKVTKQESVKCTQFPKPNIKNLAKPMVFFLRVRKMVHKHSTTVKKKPKERKGFKPLTVSITSIFRLVLSSLKGPR